MVRHATEKDLSFLKHAWQVCFDDPQAFIDWNFARNFAYADTLVAETEGVPASNLQLMPHRIQLRHTAYAVNYVSGVATLPKFRNRGLVRELFAFAFPEMRRRQEPISLLVPFSYAFYEKFGYRQCYQKTFRYADALPAADYLTADDLSPRLIARLDAVYRRAMRAHTGYALRSQEDWQRILEDLLLLSQGRILFHHTDAAEDGYALLAPRAEGGWEIHEALGVCALPCREEQKPFAMARIIDAKRVLTDLAADFDGRLRLQITDEQIPANNLTLELADGQARPVEQFDVSLDIKELAPLVFGFAPDPTECGFFSPCRPYLNMIF